MKKSTAPKLYNPGITIVRIHNSSIPGVRCAIRKELNLLRSTSIAVVILGLLTEAILCVGAENLVGAIGTVGALIAVAIGVAIGLLALFLSFSIRFSANEISDQLKRLNEEA